jgi:hypothetical protein
MFEAVVDFLTGIAIFIAIITLYFKLNKIWKRRKEKEVAESQSIVALTSESLLYLLWISSFILKSDWNALADNAIGLVESAFFLVIGTGIFVASATSQNKNFWQSLKDALKLEKKEASYLLKAISGNYTAGQIVSILHELAWIDDKFDKSEIKFVRDFANVWGVKIDETKFNDNPHKSAIGLVERIDNVKDKLSKYLVDNNPKREQADELSKLFHLLINADGTIEQSEDILIGELDAIILKYYGEPVPKYFVISVPQIEEQRALIESVLISANPGINVKEREKSIDGGFGFIMHECLTIAYAELKAQEERNDHKIMTIIREENND